MAFYWSVDRLEGEIAVCIGDDRSSRQIPLDALPDDVREGDCLREDGGVYLPAPEETARRREAGRRLLEQLLKRGQ